MNLVSKILSYHPCAIRAVLLSVDGCPTTGPLYEKRKKCKHEVASYLSKCRARLEWKKTAQCDEMFTHHHLHHFRSYTKRSAGSSIMADGSLITDLPEVLSNWVNHFSMLSCFLSLPIIHFWRNMSLASQPSKPGYMQRVISSWTLP